MVAQLPATAILTDDDSRCDAVGRFGRHSFVDFRVEGDSDGLDLTGAGPLQGVNEKTFRGVDALIERVNTDAFVAPVGPMPPSVLPPEEAGGSTD